MNKTEKYISPIAVVNVTANDYKEHPYFKYYPKRIIKFLGFNLKVIPEHIFDDYTYYTIDNMPDTLEVIDGVVYTIPHVWVNYFKMMPKSMYFKTYDEALSYARTIAKEHNLILDK